MNPKVFLSHASEDKARFVTEFATKLRTTKGIDVWLDEWEILPGDSIVDKIFEEGINNAQAIIVVLSKYSIDKPWVKEELNAAMVKRINAGSKLIPIVLDNCEVPAALRSTVWVNIQDLNDYNSAFERIVNSIFEQRQKPTLSAPPSYATTPVDRIGSLNKQDTLVLVIGCEEAIRVAHSLVDIDATLNKTRSLEISNEQCFESLEVLESMGYVKVHRVFNTERPVDHFRIEPYGFEHYASVFIEGYEATSRSIGLQIINLAQRNSREISAALNQPIMLVNHVIGTLEGSRLLKVNKSMTGDYNLFIYNVSPALRRHLED